MNDNNQINHGKEKNGQKKLTPRQRQKRNRKATLAAVLCFAAAIAIVGAYTMRDYRNVKKEGELVKAQLEEQQKALEKSSQEASGRAQKEEETGQTELDKTKEDAPGQDQAGEDKAMEDKSGAEEVENNCTVKTAGNTSSASFTDNSKMIWPVNGVILMNYSMDKTVYFSTLDQYKYNPALIIAGAEGDQVLCGAPGVIKSIDVTARTGTTVTVDLGNGYEAFYGQLKEVPVKVGDQVEAKSILGYVGQPTKYYSVEGCNVYMELHKDGVPVNPVDYMTKR